MPRNNELQKILLIGSGPIVIGQGCEFDYSGVQACKALREEGYQVVLVNSNPATIMTDPDSPTGLTSSRSRPKSSRHSCSGKTGRDPANDGRPDGTQRCHGIESQRRPGAAQRETDRRERAGIAKGEDRQLFKEAMLRIGLDVRARRCAFDRRREPGRGHDRQVSAHHSPGVYARRFRRRHRLQPD